MQQKPAFSTGKLRVRTASKEDLLSTTYLLPSIRSIFAHTTGDEQATVHPNSNPIALVEPQTMITSPKPVAYPNNSQASFVEQQTMITSPKPATHPNSRA